MRLDAPRRAGPRESDQLRPSTRALTPDGLWRRQLASPFSAIRLALLRLSRSRWLLLTVALGILVADVLICTVPLFNTLVADIELQRAIAAADPLAANTETQVRTDAISTSARETISADVTRLANQRFGTFTENSPNYYVVGGVMALAKVAGKDYSVTNGFYQSRVEALDFTTAAPHMKLVSGQLPRNTPAAQPPDVLITQETATSLKAAPGDTITIRTFGNTRRDFTYRVSGVWIQTNPNDPYWNGLTFAAFEKDDSPPVFPLVTTYDNFFGSLNNLKDVGMTQHWVYYVAPSRITTENMDAVKSAVIDYRARALGTLQSTPGVANVIIQGSLDTTITNVQKTLNLLSLPLYVIAAQIVGLALLFVAAMAGLLIEHQGQDIATLKSRGTSGTQLLGIFATQGGILALLAAIAAPFLATLLGLGLVRWFIPSAALQSTGAQPNYLAGIAHPTSVALPAVVGALLGLVVVVVSAMQAARLDVLAFRRELARPSRQPFWRRYYLDLGLVVLCVIGYVELDQFGGTATRLELGDKASSPLQLVTPALLLLAGALLVLRVIPVAARLGERVAARGKGLTSMLAFAQIERSPSRYTRMTLLLMLAVGLGLFALTFDASLARNIHDRTVYNAGADVTLTTQFGIDGPQVQAYSKRLASYPGVERVTPVYRTAANTSVDLGNNALDVLGVDPATFAGVAGPVSWRADYANQSLDSLMAGLRTHAAGANAGSTTAPIWTIISSTLASQLRIRQGDQFTLQVNDLPFGHPTFVAGAIIDYFPTLYPNGAPGGFLVLNEQDLFTLIRNGSDQVTGRLGPNEFWLRENGTQAQHANLLKSLDRDHSDLSINRVVSLRERLADAGSNPVSAGMRGLLLVGAITSAFLAVFGSLIQATIAARQRTTQFAILRTLGMAGRQMTGLLLGEQTVVYLFGLVGGTLLGLLLTTATWPFLQFSDSAAEVGQIGVPPYLVLPNWTGMALFYGALLVAFVVALLLAATYSARIGLGKALRLGED